MRVLRRASFSYLLRHPWQLLLAIVGVAAGVAVMVAVDIATDSAGRAFDLSMDAVNGAATHQIVGGPGGIDEDLYRNLRVSAGMRNIAPVVEGYVEAGNATMQLLGVDIFAEREFRAWALPGSDRNDNRNRGEAPGKSGLEVVRRLLGEPGTVLLSERSAARLHAAVGQSFSIRVAGRAFDATVAGVLGNGREEGLDNLLIADIATAQAWLDRTGRLSRIDVRLPPDSRAALRSLEASLPDGVRVMDAEGRTRAVRGMSEAFTTNLKAMSLLALLVGVFLIYNSVSFTVLQRRELLGVLRALGLTRRETLFMVLGETMLLGLAGSLAGLAGGVVLGNALLDLVSRSINDLYFVLSVTAVSVAPMTLAKGLAAGIATALGAALFPAIEASASEPRLAMTRSTVEARSTGVLRILLLSGLAIAATAVVLMLLSGRSLGAGLLAIFMLLFGFALVIPFLVQQFARLAEPLAARAAGTTGRLAIAGVRASLSRTGIAVVALAVAVSATIGVTVMVDSFREAVVAWVDRSLRADLYVGVPNGSLDAGLIPALLAVDGIRAHSSSRRVWLEDDGVRTRLVVLDMPPEAFVGTELLDGEPATAWPAFQERGAVLVSASHAFRHRGNAGDSLTLPAADGPRDFAIAGTYQSYDADLDAVLMSRATYERFWNDSLVDSLGLYLEPGASTAAVTERLREASNGRQSLVIRANAELRAMTLQVFDRTFVITDVLYWLALGVAMVGIFGAMLALQLERGREYAILRAIGLTPGELGRLVTGQSAFIGTVSGLVAIPLGLVMAFLLIEVINRRAFGWQMAIAVSPGVLVSAVLLSATAALLAGLYPAWRAASARPARAMREE